MESKDKLELKVTYVSVGRNPEVWRITMTSKTSIRYLKTQLLNYSREIARKGGGSKDWVKKYFSEDDPVFGTKDFKFFFKNMLVGDVYYKKVFQWIFAAAEVTKEMISQDDVYAFEVLHNTKDESTVFSKILRNNEIAVIPFCEFRYFCLIPKYYPDGRNTLMRKKFIAYPICGRFFNYCTNGKEVYETSLSILRYFMVDNAREILLRNSDGEMDLDDPKTLFQTPNLPVMRQIREEKRKMFESGRITYDEAKLESPLNFDEEEFGGHKIPLLRVECYAEEDMYKPVDRNDKIDVWYHPEHIIDISNMGSLLAGRNLYQHEQDTSEEGSRQYLHVKFNIRFPQIYGIDLFDESKVGEESFVEKYSVDLQSYIFDPDVLFRLEELKMMEFEETDQLMNVKIFGKNQSVVTQITTFKWLFCE